MERAYASHCFSSMGSTALDRSRSFSHCTISSTAVGVFSSRDLGVSASLMLRRSEYGEVRLGDPVILGGERKLDEGAESLDAFLGEEPRKRDILPNCESVKVRLGQARAHRRVRLHGPTRVCLCVCVFRGDDIRGRFQSQRIAVGEQRRTANIGLV